ncbi:MAG TPA: DUF5309 domain-containing protein [Rhizomicrobium sp.]|nr:DUF5309 domain-containing protein [Rhizomicrobium sp.]
MTAPTNTATTLTTKGIREDLEETIYRVAPEKTPFTSAIGTVKAEQTSHEWQTETLDTPSHTNAQLEGDDVGTLDAETAAARIGNICQIFRKTGGVSRTDEVVKKAGRKSEMNRQKVLKGIALRTDMEKRFLGNYASNAESGATPRRAGGLNAFLTTNVSNGAGGSNGGFGSGVVAAATPGTSRAFTEALVKNVLATAFGNGATPSLCFVGGTHKQQFSAFTGIASIRADVANKKQATIYAGADVYVSDFGAISIVPHPYGMGADALFVDPDMAAVATLDGVKTEALAKSGDSEKFIMTAEKTLVCRNEKAHAVIRALS